MAAKEDPPVPGKRQARPKTPPVGAQVRARALEGLEAAEEGRTTMCVMLFGWNCDGIYSFTVHMQDKDKRPHSRAAAAAARKKKAEEEAAKKRAAEEEEARRLQEEEDSRLAEEEAKRLQEEEEARLARVNGILMEF